MAQQQQQQEQQEQQQQPEEPQEVHPEAPPAQGKGKAFFDRADEVGETGNWDFAIQMYIEGIRRECGNLQRGHRPLRDVSLKRKAQGGKAVGLIEQFKRKTAKDPIEALVNAEYLLAKDPGNVTHMVAVFKAVRKLEDIDPAVTHWISTILLDAMHQAKRPNKHICMMIAEAFAEIEAYKSAVLTCDLAVRAFPNDGNLAEMAKNLSARDTIKQGQYDGETSFVSSVRDMGKQIDLLKRDQMAQSREFIEQEIERARQEYQDTPSVAGKIEGVVDALLKVEEETYENEALDILKKAFAESKAYRFKMRADDVTVRQARRRIGKLKSQDRNEAALKATQELLAFELKMYAERGVNYPTDLSIKYELGRRQLDDGQTDNAIGSLQHAQRDPKRRIQALALLGKAFAKKEWHREAVETYQRALDLEPNEERAKELHYNLGDSLESMDEHKDALEHFSQVAQIDYNYRDVRDRIEGLRKKTR